MRDRSLKHVFPVAVVAGLLAAGGLPATARAAEDLFAPVYQVLQHPRCSNCHSGTAGPRQQDGRVHVPPVRQGLDGRGTGSLACGKCHRDRNTATAPGAPDWRMPSPAATRVFRGRSAAELCRQLADPARNGGLDFEGLGRHVATDPLIAWAWDAGPGRPPPPLSREATVAALARWLKAGAPCPGS